MASQRPAREVLWAAGVIGFGLLMSTLPHVVNAWTTGSPFWIADNDEAMYLCFAARAYHSGGLHMLDPMTGQPGVLYPWLQLMPGTLLTRLLGLSPFYIGVVWRIMAGVSIGAAWWILFRRTPAARPVAAGLACILLCDPGLVLGCPVVYQFSNLLQLLQHPGELLGSNPQLHTEWRLITPGLSLAFLIGYMVCLVREPDRRWWRYTGVALGLLFWMYFYYWTTALLGLVLWAIFERSRARGCLAAAGLGLVIGLPALLQDWALRQHGNGQWLARSDKFVPIGRWSELHFPRTLLLILLLTGIAVWRRPHPLRGLWLLAVASLLLLNHQIVTGLQIENWHWSLFVLGPICTALLLLLAAHHLRGPRWTMAVVAVAVACMIVGCYTRVVEAAQSQESVFWTHELSQYRANGFGAIAPAGGTIAGDLNFVSLMVIDHDLRPLDHYAAIFSPNVSDQDWQMRIALNGLLQGDDDEIFMLDQARAMTLNKWGPWGRDRLLMRRMLAQREALFSTARSHLEELLDAYDIRYIAIRRPSMLPAALSTRFHLLQADSDVMLYQLGDRLETPVKARPGAGRPPSDKPCARRSADSERVFGRAPERQGMRRN